MPEGTASTGTELKTLKELSTCVVCGTYPAPGRGTLVLTHRGKVFMMGVCPEHVGPLATGIDKVMVEMANNPILAPHPSKETGFFALVAHHADSEWQAHEICGHCFAPFCIRVAMLCGHLNPERVPVELTSFIGTFNEWRDQHGDQ
jgi:hypothetical protein